MTGRRPLKTPGFVKAMFPGEDVISPAAFVMPAQAAVRPLGAAPPAAPAAAVQAPAADVGGGAGARAVTGGLRAGCMQVSVLVQAAVSQCGNCARARPDDVIAHVGSTRIAAV